MDQVSDSDLWSTSGQGPQVDDRSLTSELLRNVRCPSVIASKAEVVGAKTVIGPGRSRTEDRSVF